MIMAALPSCETNSVHVSGMRRLERLAKLSVASHHLTQGQSVVLSSIRKVAENLSSSLHRGFEGPFECMHQVSIHLTSSSADVFA